MGICVFREKVAKLKLIAAERASLKRASEPEASERAKQQPISCSRQ